ncbi:beta strand repeat-containing protein [Lysinibacter cavernae]|uniref:Alpha-amylase n=1 Tax=Lysinibacter cavernae TaxID=1640652 RepID=A0A7X5R261_9MICO|nr:Ig-like domain-containing protein [Lysinibacter cavernae]NIH54005.1 hypothetical protein [Lysinibacter cavernae]
MKQTPHNEAHAARPVGSRLRRAAARVLVCVLAVTAAAGMPTAAVAAPVDSVSIDLVADGQAPFDLGDGPGLDRSATNGIIRTQDTVSWELGYTAGADGSARFIATLPVGAKWNATSVTSTVCTGPGGGYLSADSSTMTCNRLVTAGDVARLPVSAVIGALPNGTRFTPSVVVGAVAATGAAELTVSAAPRTQLSVYNAALEGGTTVNGTLGVTSRLSVFLGAEVDPQNPKFLGYEALANSFQFVIDVPANAIVQSENTSTVSTTQDAPGSPVTVSVTGLETSFLNPSPSIYAGPMASSGDSNDARIIRELKIALFVPYEGNVNVGETISLNGRVHSFDPNSLSGQSNFGDDVAPGQADAGPCPSTDANGTSLSCFGRTFTRATAAVVMTGAIGTMADDASGQIYGDANASTGGTEAVVVGQRFRALSSIYNAASAGSPATNAYGSVTWNAELLNLSATPEVVLNTARSGASSFFGFTAYPLFAPAPADSYVLEYTDYAFVNDAQRKSLLSFGDTEPTWTEDPSTLPGGLASVTSIRVRYLDALEPNTTVGIVTPFERAAASADLAVNATLPWFWQYGADDKAVVKSTYSGTGVSSQGGAVQAAEALVRADLSWERVEGATYAAGLAERGDIVNLRIAPTVIGPVLGPDAVATDATITVTMPNACLEPVVAALPSRPLEYTPGIPGTTCATGTPGKIVFRLGDLAAPAGEAGPWSLQGHGTALTPILVPVRVSMSTPVPSTPTAKLVVSSPSDPTTENNATYSGASALALSQDRTASAPITVSGAAVFKTSKVASTAVTGLIGPGEEMSYTITWANASSSRYLASSFVDLLPFEGDERGTTGLGEGELNVVNVVAAMDEATQGSVAIEYTTDASAAVQAALALADNETGATGIHWETLSGDVPAGVTALRFTPSGPLEPGYSGNATIRVQVPGLTLAGAVNNNVSMRVIAEAGTSIISRTGANRPLASSAALISGNVLRDLDFSNSVTPADPVWSGATVELRDGERTVATAETDSAGNYAFEPVAAGTYRVVLSEADREHWAAVAPVEVTVLPQAVQTGVGLLYQEVVAAPVLVDDSSVVAVGTSQTIDVLANDTIAFPTAVGSSYEKNTLALVTPPTTGTVSPAVSASQPDIGAFSYSPSSVWPEAHAGSATYTDTFQYSYTNAAGEARTATVTVTVSAVPVATNDAFTIADAQAVLDVLGGAAPDTGNAIQLDAAHPPTTDADATVTYSSGKLQITPTHSWLSGELTYDVPVSYTIVDALGMTATAVATVTIQRAPVLAAGAILAVTVPSGTAASFIPVVLTAGTLSGYSLASPPPAGLVTVNGATSAVSFATAGLPAGLYPFTVGFRDNLGQTLGVTYLVTVLGGPRVIGDTDASIGEGRSVTFDGFETSSSLASVAVTTEPSAGTATVDPVTGALTFSAGDASPGTYSVVVRATDANGLWTDAMYSVTVVAAPTVAGPYAVTVAEGAVATFAPEFASTVELQNARLSASPESGAATVNAATGAISYQGEPGIHSFSVTFTDSVGQDVVAVYTVTVQARPVVTGALTSTIAVGSAAAFAPAVTTTGSVSGAVLTTPPVAGAVVVDPATGASSFDAAGIAAGTYRYEVTFTDNLGQTVVATHTVIVQAPPVADGVTAVVAEGGRIVLPQRVSTAGSIASVVVTAPPAAGTAALIGSDLVFDAGDALPGPHSFTVTFTDSLGQAATAVYIVTVQAGPVVEGVTSATIGENDKVTFEPIVVTEGSLSSVEVSNQPARVELHGTRATDAVGSVSVDATTGEVTYRSERAVPGVYAFSVTFVDNLGQHVAVEYTVTVQAAITASGGEVTIPEHGSHSFVHSVVTDGTVSDTRITSAPSAGTAQLVPGGIQFAAGEAGGGRYEIEVTYTDNVGQQATAGFVVVVQAAPTAKNVVVKIPAGTQSVTVDPLGAVTGTHLQGIRLADVLQPTHGFVTLGENNLLIYTAPHGFAGTVTFSVTVLDDLGQHVTFSYTIEVEAAEAGGVPSLGGTIATTGSVSGLPIGIVALLAMLLGFGGLAAGRRRASARQC